MPKWGRGGGVGGGGGEGRGGRGGGEGVVITEPLVRPKIVWICYC